MSRSITIAPGQSMSEVLNALKIGAGDELVIEIPADASVLLTANEFRALSIAAERDEVEVSIYTDDPLRRQLATLFGVPLVNEIPEPQPYVAPELEPVAETEPLAAPDDLGPDDDDGMVAEPERPSRGGSSAPKALGSLVAIAAVAFIAAGLYWFFFSTMTVDLHLKRAKVASTLAYQVIEPGASAGAATSGGIVIPGTAVEFTLTRTLTAAATGQTVIPDKAASGELTLRNPTDAELVIEKGTPFQGFSGVTYLFQDQVTVPAAANGQPGETTAVVTAPDGGEAGNAGVGMLTGQLPNGVYYSNRMSEVSGGTQKTVTTVSQSDLDALKAELDKELLALAKTTELDGGLLLVPSTVAPAGDATAVAAQASPYAFSQQAGEVATEVSLTGTVPFTGTAYDPTALTEAAIPQLQAEVAAGQTFDPASVMVNTPAETGNSNGVISLLATVSGEVIPTLDDATRNALADQLAGESKAANDQTLHELDYVDGFSVTYAPSWLPERVPSAPGRITIETS